MFVYLSDIDEHESLIGDYGRFSDAIRSRPKLSERQIALVSLDGDTVIACARVTRGTKVVSYKWRAVFDEFVEFKDAITFDELEAAVSHATALRIAKVRAQGGGEVSPKAGSETISAIQRIP